MLYNGCLKFLTLAKKAMLDKDIQTKNTNLQKAQAIITELMVTLDMNVPISKEIQPLYDYMNRRLLEANIKNDPAMIDEVAGLMTEFRDTWKEVIRLNRQQQHSGVGDQA